MRNSSYMLLSLLGLVAGILLVMYRDYETLYSTIVIIIGILFLAGAVVFGAQWALRSRQRNKLESDGDVNLPYQNGAGMIIAAAGALILGLLFVCMPVWFSTYLIYTFAAVLILCGIAQAIFLSSAMRILGVSPAFLVMPLLTIVGGIVCCVLGHNHDYEHILTLCVGIIFICWSINGLTGYVHRHGKVREYILLHPAASLPRHNDQDAV